MLAAYTAPPNAADTAKNTTVHRTRWASPPKAMSAMAAPSASFIAPFASHPQPGRTMSAAYSAPMSAASTYRQRRSTTPHTRADASTRQ